MEIQHDIPGEEVRGILEAIAATGKFWYALLLMPLLFFNKMNQIILKIFFYVLITIYYIIIIGTLLFQCSSKYLVVERLIAYGWYLLQWSTCINILGNMIAMEVMLVIRVCMFNLV